MGGNRIKELREAQGLSQEALGELVGMSGQTVGNKERGSRGLKASEIERFAEALGVNPGDLFHTDGAAPPRLPRRPHLRESDMIEYSAPTAEDQAIENVKEALYPGHPSAAVWQITSRALDLEGYLPGDLVIVDLGLVEARSGDVVCAQVYDWQAGTAATVIRLYEPPYIISHSSDPAFRKPELADGERVVIKGIVAAGFRRPSVAA